MLVNDRHSAMLLEYLLLSRDLERDSLAAPKTERVPMEFCKAEELAVVGRWLGLIATHPLPVEVGKTDNMAILAPSSIPPAANT